MNQLVVAAEYSDEMTASIACGMLKANGIDAMVEGSNMATIYMAGATWAPVKLLVPSADLPRALDLLSQHND